MTVARELADFVTGTSPADLPEQAVDYAAMLIASTLASAALGTGIESSAIMRDLARERGGRLDASLWFHPGPKLPMADAAQVNAIATLCCTDQHPGAVSPPQRHLREANVLRPPKLEHPV
jgi:2-methylcitrate dehydratase PrpD